MRPFSLVRPRFVKGIEDYPFADDLPLIFLGEIPNMPGHGVFAGHRSGRLYSGYHIEDYEEIPEDET